MRRTGSWLRVLRRNSGPVYGLALSPGARGLTVATRTFPKANFLGQEAYHLARPRRQELIHSPALKAIHAARNIRMAATDKRRGKAVPQSSWSLPCEQKGAK